MVDFINPVDTFFVNFFSQFTTHYSIELFVAILLYLVYFYVFYAFYYFFRNKNHKSFFHLFTTIMIGFLIVFSLKYYVNRPRPYETFHLPNVIVEKNDPSFPSAHTFLGFFIYYFISKIAKLKRFKTFILLHLLILIPLGSMLIGVHYFTDVLAGAFIGFILPRIISEEVIVKLYSKTFLGRFFK